MGSTTAPTWLVLLAPIAAVVAAGIAAWTSRLSWRAEQRREHQRWVREQRTQAYLHFLDTGNDMLWAARARKRDDRAWTPEVEWLEPLDKALLRVQLFGSAAVARQAQLAVRAFAEGVSVATGTDGRDVKRNLSILQELVDTIRADLTAHIGR